VAAEDPDLCEGAGGDQSPELLELYEKCRGAAKRIADDLGRFGFVLFFTAVYREFMERESREFPTPTPYIR